MNLLRKALVPLAGAATIVLVLSIGGPRAVHAVVAALVQVENTPTNAVPTVAAPAASQLYSSVCSGSYNTTQSVTFTCSFTPVPAGQTLFIETESIWSTSDHGSDPFIAEISNGFSATYVSMAQQASFPGQDSFTGAVAGRMWAKAGTTPYCEVALNNGSSSGNFTCNISGYLAPAM